MSGTSHMKQVLIYDYHPAISKGLSNIVEFELNADVTLQPLYPEDDLLKVLREMNIGLILMDIRSPEKNGFGLIKKIMADDQGLKILIFSGYDQDLYAEDAIRAGAKGFIMKFESVGEILRAIQIVLGNGIYRSNGISQP